MGNKTKCARRFRQNGITLKGRQHGFRLKAFECDTPARSYILNIKGDTAYFECSKCIQQGDYEGRVIFLECNSKNSFPIGTAE